MRIDRRKVWRRAAVAAVAVLVLLGLNHLMTFPMAFRDGDPAAWLGRGPAGAPLQRVYSLVEAAPAVTDSVRGAELRERLKAAGMLEDHSAYPTCVSLGFLKYWESSRRVLLAPPPTTLSYQVTIPPRAVLDFGFALARYPKKPKGYPKRPSTDFVIEWRDANGTRQLFRETVKLEPPGFWEKNKERLRFFRMYLKVALEEDDDMYRDRRVDLSALAGRTGTLRFITAGGGDGKRKDGKADAACLPAVWSAPEVWAERGTGEPAPVNVVIFMIEATPAHMVPPYPGNPGVMPVLREFSEQAAVFDRFFVAGGSTQLSVPCYFTGRHFKSLGLPANVNALERVVKERFYARRFTGLAEAFGRAGYTTVELGTNHYIQPNRDFGVDVGFDRIEILGRRYYAHVDTTLATMQWLRRNGSKPFLLYVHYDSPHQEDKPCLEDVVKSLGVKTGDGRWKYRKYLAQLMRADLDFGRLLSALEQLGVRGRTLVVVTADHGNNLNPATAFTLDIPGKDPWAVAFVHDQAMGMEDINPPLLIDWPIGPAGAVRSSAPLSSVDLFPTLTQLVLKDLNPDTAARMADIDGRSFAGILDPAFPPFPGRDLTYSLAEGGEMIVMRGQYHYAARTQEYSRLVFPVEDRLRIVRERLFDINADPLEAQDLSGARPELLGEARRLLRERRPAEPVMSLLFLGYPGGHVRGMIGVSRKSGMPAAGTIPEKRAPIVLTPLGEDPATGTVIVGFEADLTGPTGLMLDDAVKWVWVQHGDTTVTGADLRLGRFGLPLLAAAGGQALIPVTLPDGRQIPAVSLAGLDPAVLACSALPTGFSGTGGVYYYRMTFSDLIGRNYSDKALSASVRSILKEWGYIH